ncbi:peptide chain release factor N(5)-glutamine methyltransferase [Arthrobacter sp. H35-D1]|uniref:peptide chain release factor N(5)-glutamine methyltransferase n=1 Tax=Arthrobacter sp. H35-D1 TaxID=3046202 RepID=UPI0024BBD138|nr:peptide chain release factor N(5)-glutamine methyltransferase [Arthrobacter sp. H35-D1]MDJ0313057.1 peptide chain release factor N(5)-glutamine methyltransferase [Arthrobacter sp. H35-D1]
MPGTPLADAVRDATAALAAAGVPSPAVDAQLLAAHLVGVGRGELAAMLFGTTATPTGYAELVARRAAREPLQHITGVAYFRHLELAVGKGVFVPRPETESVVQLGIDVLTHLHQKRGRESEVVAVDLGTGSGAIAAAMATEVPGSRVYAVELSADAYPWAARNLAGTGVVLVQGDMRDAFAELDGCVDVVVSNPPYIPAGAVPRDVEVQRHDPHMALYGGGADGMEMPTAAMATAARLLRPGGFFVMEHAEVQAAQMAELLEAGGHWKDVCTHHDLTGRERATSGIRR